MAAIQSRERSSSTKRPFQWIQRLYKKSSNQENDQMNGEGVVLESHRTSGEAPFLGIGDTDDHTSSANDLSSLRPTISTRPPSIAQSTASNAAIHNFEAISSPLADPALARSIDQPDVPRVALLSERYVPLNDDDTLINDDLPGVHDSDQNLETKSSNTADDPFMPTEGNDGPYLQRKEYPDSKSSKESSIPSIFSNKTAETAPTASLFAGPTSIISSHRGNPGAQDNASMLTLASSGKAPNRRRTSTDTNCSVRAIAPASNRASFESSRTGQTDSRRTSHFNPNSVLFLDDVNGTSAGRSRPLTSDMSSLRKSVSGLSAVS